MLTHNAIAQMVQAQGQTSDPAFQPVLQIIQVRQVSSGGAAGDRYRVILSDGQYHVHGMLATQLTHLVHSQQLRENAIVSVKDFMNNQVSGKTVIILLDIDIINPDRGYRVGDPTDVEKTNLVNTNAGSNVAPPSAQPMYNSTNQANPTSNNVFNSSNNAYKPSNTNTGNPYDMPSRTTTASSSSSSSSAPIHRTTTTSTGAVVTPISQLNMYQNRWTIKARVVAKSDIRTWSNARGEGSLFSTELLDASGMDIRATFFKEAVDRFYTQLEVNKVYSFSGGRLKVANMQWNTCKSNFEITFDQNAEIHLDNDTGEVPQQLYELTKIAQLEQTEPGQFVDVLGIVKHVGEPATIISKKSGQELTKADMTLVDDSGVEISLTVWGERAQSAPHEFANTPVVAFRRAKLSDYGGRSLSAGPTIVVRPSIPETQAIEQWWNAGGATQTRSLSSGGGGSGGPMEPLEQRKTVADIKRENLGYSSEKPDWITFKGSFSFLKKDKEGGAWYTACANSGEPCKNRFKVTQTTDGNWFCDKCQGTFPNCVRRWIFSGTISDDTSTTWVSLFNEQAETLFGGATADDVYRETMEVNMDQDKYDSYFCRATGTDWVFRCKVKQEMVGDESRVKTSVVAMQPVDYAKESRDLLTAIAKF